MRGPPAWLHVMKDVGAITASTLRTPRRRRYGDVQRAECGHGDSERYAVQSAGPQVGDLPAHLGACLAALPLAEEPARIESPRCPSCPPDSRVRVFLKRIAAGADSAPRATWHVSRHISFGSLTDTSTSEAACAQRGKLCNSENVCRYWPDATGLYGHVRRLAATRPFHRRLLEPASKHLADADGRRLAPQDRFTRPVVTFSAFVVLDPQRPGEPTAAIDGVPNYGSRTCRRRTERSTAISDKSSAATSDQVDGEQVTAAST